MNDMTTRASQLNDEAIALIGAMQHATMRLINILKEMDEIDAYQELGYKSREDYVDNLHFMFNTVDRSYFTALLKAAEQVRLIEIRNPGLAASLTGENASVRLLKEAPSLYRGLEGPKITEMDKLLADSIESGASTRRILTEGRKLRDSDKPAQEMPKLMELEDANVAKMTIAVRGNKNQMRNILALLEGYTETVFNDEAFYEGED